MSVYVDPLFDTEGWSTHWPYPFACHLMADAEDELHAFAATIGMRRVWFQPCPPHSLAHYDLTQRRRALAVRKGAIEVCDVFRPSRQHFRWTATGRPLADWVAMPAGGVRRMKIPTHWPNGQIMTLDQRMHFLSFTCGVVLCANCGTLVAKCGCGREALVNMIDECHECNPTLAMVNRV